MGHHFELHAGIHETLPHIVSPQSPSGRSPASACGCCGPGSDLSAENPCWVAVCAPEGSPVRFAEPCAVLLGSYCPGPGVLLLRTSA